MKIKVKQLRVGDVLSPTGRTVTAAPTAGAYTPPGKVNLALDGKAVQFWGNTQVHIKQDEKLPA